MLKGNRAKLQMTQEKVIKLESVFDEKITDWIQEYKGYGNEYDKDTIMEKTKIIAKYRNDGSLVEEIKQRMGN